RRPTALGEVGGVSGGRPGMPVDAYFAVAIEIVQDHKLLRQAVLVGSNLAPKDGQAGIPVAFGQIAEYLIVGAVLFDDVDDVLNGRPGADLAGHDGRRIRRPSFGQKRIVIRSVGYDHLRITSQLCLKAIEAKQLDGPLLQRLD